MARKTLLENPIKLEKGEVSLSQLRELIAKYYRQMKKKKGGLDRSLDVKVDTIAAWFWKKRVDDLFNANGYSDNLPDVEKEKYGLRVYYGVHDRGSILTDIPIQYDNQQMVILVVTYFNGTDHQDLLNDGNSVEISGLPDTEAGHYGLDNGKLCPPDTGCEGSTLRKAMIKMLS